jgi:hypothetical protein
MAPLADNGATEAQRAGSDHGPAGRASRVHVPLKPPHRVGWTEAVERVAPETMPAATWWSSGSIPILMAPVHGSVPLRNDTTG